MVRNLTENERHESMRGWFEWELHKHMIKCENIWVLTGDLGFGMFDKIKRDFPTRFLNVGAAEQAMVSIAIGLALENKIPIVYSITPFLLYRPFEAIRNYIHYENTPIKLVGSGRARDYLNDGFSHWAEEDHQVMKIFSNIDAYWPEEKEDIPNLLRKILFDKKPTYINLRR